MVGVFALSVSDQVVKIGAFVGFAAFIGLAVLSLLYFAQARELKRLREWAGRAPERAQELQDRVVLEAEQAARRVKAEPQAKPAAATAAAVTAAAKPGTAAPAAAAVPPTGAPGTPQSAPAQAATAGDGGPPKPGEPAKPGEAAKPGEPAKPGEAAKPAEGAPAKPGAPAAPGTPAPAGAPAPAAPGAPAPAAPAGAPAPASAPDAPGSNGSPTPAPVPATASAQPGALAPSTAAARGTAGPIPSDDTGEYTVEEDAVVAPAPLPPPRRPAPAPLRSNAAATRRPAPPREAPPKAGRSGRKTVLAVLAGLLVLGGVGFGATQLLGGDEADAPPPNQPAPSANETPDGTDSGGDEASTTPRDELVVHVLNGTTVSGLAAGLADTLRNEGFAEPITGNNADQQRTESEVLFADGHRADARDVAEALNIETVAELDPTTTTSSEGADIVVIVGADKAQ